MTDEERLISMVQKDVGRSSINIVTAVPSFLNMSSLGAHVGDEVARAGDLIVVGDNVIAISTRKAESWSQQSLFKHRSLTTKEIACNLNLVKELFSAHNLAYGLGEMPDFVRKNCLEKGKNAMLNPYARMIIPCLFSLQKAILKKNSQAIREAAKRIGGLGPGLTPSGDDVLSGVMISLVLLAINLRQQAQLKVDEVLTINKLIVDSVVGRTTLISQEFLMNAMVGETNERIVSLVEKILTASHSEVQSSANEVLNIGAYSGADVILGILLGSRLQLGIAAG